MTDYTQAADALKRMAVQYKNIVAVADALESLGSIQGAAKEADAALAKARKERDAFTAQFDADVAKCNAQLALAQAAADKVLTDAKAEGAELKQKTQAAAEKKAQSIVEKAQAEADKVLSGLATGVEAGQAELTKINETISAETLALDEITKATAEAQAQHDKLDKALSALKAKFA